MVIWGAISHISVFTCFPIEGWLYLLPGVVVKFYVTTKSHNSYKFHTFCHVSNLEAAGLV